MTGLTCVTEMGEHGQENREKRSPAVPLGARAFPGGTRSGTGPAKGRMLKTTLAAANLAARYSGDVRYTTEALQDVFNYVVSFVPGGSIRAVDVGAGTGVPTRVLERTARICEVLAVDISPEMLQAVATRPGRKRVAGDAAQLPFRNQSFDLTVCVLALHLLDDKRRAMSEFRRVTVTGGIVAVVLYEHHDLDTQVFHRLFPVFSNFDRLRHPTLEMLRTLSEAEGLVLVGQRRAEFRIRFRNKDELLDLVGRRPFFTLQQLPDDLFEAGFDDFRRRVAEEPIDELESPSAITAMVFQVRVSD